MNARSNKAPATAGTVPGVADWLGVDVNDLTVTCGCGRKMALDPMRGRGSYRCGCGVRIKAVLPAYRPETCMAVVDGQRCRKAPKTEGATLLCKQHLNDLKGALGLIRPEELPEYTDRLAAAQMGVINSDDPEFDQDDWLAKYAERRVAAEREQWAKKGLSDPKTFERHLNPGSVVYFIRMGDLIKIGYTSNLIQRVQGLSLTMGHVLVAIPGASALESELHRRFAEYREHGEWFRAVPEILDYVEAAKRTRRAS